MKQRSGGLGLILAAVVAAGAAHAADPTQFEQVGPDQLSFSVENMDRSVDPRVDFYRYASGAWLRRVERPERMASIGVFDFMAEHMKAQMTHVLTRAAQDAPTAAKGSPLQQVGDLYRAYTDLARLNALGATALKDEFARIDAITTTAQIATYLGRYPAITGDVAIAAIVPSTDRADATRMQLYFVSGMLILKQEALYKEPDTSPRIAAYLAFLRDILILSGREPARAGDIANTALAIERQLQAAKITPVEAVDPRKTYDPQKLGALQAVIPELDLAAVIRGSGAEPPDTVIQTEPRYLPVLGAVLKARPLDDFKDYLKLRLLVRFAGYLGEAYDAPLAALNKALVGVSVLPPRPQRAQDMMREYLGAPVSRLYVENFFPEASRAQTRDMIERIRAAFLARMEQRDWLTGPTKAAAIDKLKRLSFRIGYPDRWVDYASVDIRPDDLIGNIMRLSAFSASRDVAKIDKPVVPDQFNNTRATLPIIINAAYDSQTNGFEIPAAFLQPPAFDPRQDAAVNFCRVGAVIGHEMTHGFDSGGRLFDAAGNMRDWWTPGDAAAFATEAQKLVEQANAFEVLPGLKANGALEVRENMADVGGINFAYAALRAYLKDHPADDKIVDGLTPAQRCFVAWAQMWTMKATEQAIRNEVMNDGHPPGLYRAVAALQHVDGFYEAFGIKPGDRMWLPPEKRVRAW